MPQGTPSAGSSLIFYASHGRILWCTAGAALSLHGHTDSYAKAAAKARGVHHLVVAPKLQVWCWERLLVGQPMLNGLSVSI